jgi:hypothetical protein
MWTRAACAWRVPRPPLVGTAQPQSRSFSPLTLICLSSTAAGPLSPPAAGCCWCCCCCCWGGSRAACGDDAAAGATAAAAAAPPPAAARLAPPLVVRCAPRQATAARVHPETHTRTSRMHRSRARHGCVWRLNAHSLSGLLCLPPLILLCCLALGGGAAAAGGVCRGGGSGRVACMAVGLVGAGVHGSMRSRGRACAHTPAGG